MPQSVKSNENIFTPDKINQPQSIKLPTSPAVSNAANDAAKTSKVPTADVYTPPVNQSIATAAPTKAPEVISKIKYPTIPKEQNIFASLAESIMSTPSGLFNEMFGENSLVKSIIDTPAGLVNSMGLIFGDKDIHGNKIDTATIREMSEEYKPLIVKSTEEQMTETLEFLNRPAVRKIITTSGDALSNIPLKVFSDYKSIFTGKDRDKILNDLIAAGEDPNSSYIVKLLYNIQNTAVQTAIGALGTLAIGAITKNPKLASAYAYTYYTVISADAQVKEKGKVDSLKDIAIDVFLDRPLGNILESFMGSPKKLLAKMLLAGNVEGGTEVLQTVMKLSTDWIYADTKGKKAVEEKMAQYFSDPKNGALMEYLVGGVAGGVAGGSVDVLFGGKGGSSTITNVEVQADKDLIKDSVDQAKQSIGEEPSIIKESIEMASENIDNVPEDKTMYHRTNADTENIKNQGFIMKEGALGKGAYFSDLENLEDNLYGDNKIELKTSDFNLKTIATNEEASALMKETGTTSISDAVRAEGKYDGFIWSNPDPSIGNVYVLTNGDLLNQNLFKQQLVTSENAKQTAETFKFIEKLNIPIEIKQKINSQNGEAFGQYSAGIIAFNNNPHKTTAPHEALHAYLDIMSTVEEKAAVIEEAMNKYGTDDTSVAEEKLAQDFAKYYVSKIKQEKPMTLSQKIKSYFDNIIQRIKDVLSGKESTAIEKLYKDIESRKPSKTQKAKYDLLVKQARGEDTFQDYINPDPRYQLMAELKADPEGLTTKFLQSKQYQSAISKDGMIAKNSIKQVINAQNSGFKKAEIDLINDVLNVYYSDVEKINAKEFENAVRSELVKLDIIESNTYADYGSKEIFGDKAEYKTLLFNSDYGHDYKGHFTGDFAIKIPANELEIREIPIDAERNPDSIKYALIRKNATMNEDNIAESVLFLSENKIAVENKRNTIESDGVLEFEKSGLFSHARLAQGRDGNTMYITELQSDPYQRNAERVKILYPTVESIQKRIDDNNARIKTLEDRIKDYTDFINTNPLAIIEANKSLIENISNEIDKIQGDSNLKLFQDSLVMDGTTMLRDATLNKLKENGFNIKDYFDVLPDTLKGKVFLDIFSGASIMKQYAYTPEMTRRILQEKIGTSLSDENAIIKNKLDIADTTIREARSLLDFTKNHIKERELEIEKLKKIDPKSIEAKQTRLQQAFLNYKDIWQERTLKETIRYAREQMFNEVAIASPRTIALIEGYISADKDDVMPYKIKSSRREDILELDDRIEYIGKEFSIIAIDGSEITIAPTDSVRVEDISDLGEEEANYLYTEEIENTFSDLFPNGVTFKELPDAIAKSETTGNDRLPDYLNRFLGNYENIDDKIDISKYESEFKDMFTGRFWQDFDPSNFFAFEKFSYIDDYTIIGTEDRNGIETLSQPDSYDSGTEEFITDDATFEKEYKEKLADSQVAVIDFYKSKVIPYFKKLRPDAKVIDYAGETGVDYSWYVSKLNENDYKAVVAFQTKESIVGKSVSEDISSAVTESDIKNLEDELYQLELDANIFDDNYEEYVNKLKTLRENLIERKKILNLTENYEDIKADIKDTESDIIAAQDRLESYNNLIAESPAKFAEAYIDRKEGQLEEAGSVLRKDRYGNVRSMTKLDRWRAMADQIITSEGGERYGGFDGMQLFEKDWASLQDMKMRRDDARRTKKALEGRLVELKKIDREATRIAKEEAELNVKSKKEYQKEMIRKIKRMVKTDAPKYIFDEKRLLKMRIRAIIHGIDMGSKDTRVWLNQEFKDKTLTIEERKKAVLAYANKLPKEEIGALARRIATLKTDLDVQKLFNEIDRRRAMVEDKYNFNNIKKIARDISKAEKSGKGVAIEYMKLISDTLQSYDFKSPTEQTIAKLTALKQYIESDPQIEKTILIETENGNTMEVAKVSALSPSIKKMVERLNKIDLKKKDSKTILELNQTLTEMYEAGKTLYELRKLNSEENKEIEIAKVLTTTNNLDPKGKPDRSSTQIKADIKALGLDFKHTFRVTDQIDGNMRYQGENTKLYKREANAVNNAELESNAVLETAFAEMGKIQNMWSEEEQAIMMFHLLKDQGALTQAQELINAMGWKEEPAITEEMQSTMNIMRDMFATRVSELAGIYENLTNKPFEKVKNYFPLKYNNKISIIQEPTINQKVNRTYNTDKGFTYGRKKNVKKVVRTDVFSIFAEAIKEQSYYMRVQPVLMENHQVISSPEYQEKAGEVASRWWKNHLDVVANKGQLGGIPNNRLLKRLRTNISRATMGYKLSSIIVQPLAIIDATMYVNANYGPLVAGKFLIQTAMNFINPFIVRNQIAKSNALKIRKGGELDFYELDRAFKAGKNVKLSYLNKPRSLIDAFQKNSMKMLQAMDIRTAASVRRGIESILSKKLKGTELRDEADLITQIVSGSSEIADRPMVLAKGEGARTLLAFQTFALNRWGLIVDDVIKTGLIKGKLGAKGRALISLFILGLGVGAEDWLRKVTKEALGGKKDDKEPEGLLSNTIWGVIDNIPLLGNLIRSAREFGNADLSIPLARVFENIINGYKQMQSDKESSKKAGLVKVITGVGALFGIAGTQQVGELIKNTKENNTSTNEDMFGDLNLSTGLDFGDIKGLEGGLDLNLDDLNLDLNLDL